jgi:predicted DNA binding CopG/RHH family protein
MKRAVETGAVRRRKVALKTVTMAEPDIEAAKDLAFRKGLPYQTYIKMLLHEAIERERRSA